MPAYSLMQHQKEGVEFLESVDGIGALLWDPGVGKTGGALTWIDKQAQKHGEFRVLVISPLTASDTWVLQAPPFMDSAVKARFLEGSTLSILAKIKQARDWTAVPDSATKVDHPGVSGNRVTILSISAGAVSTFCTTRPKTVQLLQAVRKYQPHLVIVDESHIIKAPTSNISKALYQIGQLAQHRIILTGTVTPNGPLDVYGQWRFLAPWTFSDQYKDPYTKRPLLMTRAQQAGIRPWPFGRFKIKYTIPGGYKGKGISAYQNLDDLNNRIAERSHVVLKEDALDLPPVTDIDIHIHLNPAERKAYDEMASQLAAELASGELIEAPNALAKMMKLRQIAAGFVRDTTTGEVHVVGHSMQDAVAEVVNIQLAGEKRVVVFAYFKSECAAIADRLKQKGRIVEVVTGQTKASERLAIRRRFADVSGNPEPIVLVAQARTMSISVNELITARHAVYASMSERRNDWTQSRDRLNRKGQTSPVTFWNVFCPNTVGEVMLESHKEKGNLERRLLNHIQNYVK